MISTRSGGKGNLITISCLVDNAALRGSALRGEHGVAFSVETPDGKVLFDTGQSGEVWVHNARLMNIDLGSFDALVLSHAHYDHTGGLERFFRLSLPGPVLYANPDLFRQRYSHKDGQARSIGLRLSQEEITSHASLQMNPEPTEIKKGVWTTGEIRERREFEGRSPHHQIRVDGEWLPDPYRDDLSLVVHTSQGLVVVCGCCHAGLLNTLAHIQRCFSPPIRAIIGGTHLASVGQAELDRVIAIFRAQKDQVPYLYLNHCSGERAQAALAQAFGEKVSPCPAGTVLMFA